MPSHRGWTEELPRKLGSIARRTIHSPSRFSLRFESLLLKKYQWPQVTLELRPIIDSILVVLPKIPFGSGVEFKTPAVDVVFVPVGNDLKSPTIVFQLIWGLA